MFHFIKVVGKISILIFVSGILMCDGYKIPKPTIKAYRGQGIKVSIPDEPGIRLFAFHGKLNEAVLNLEVGDFNGEILRAVDGRWTYENKNLIIEPNDQLYYWLFVQHENLGYFNDAESFVIREVVDPNVTPRPTRPTVKPPMPRPTPTPSVRPTPAPKPKPSPDGGIMTPSPQPTTPTTTTTEKPVTVSCEPSITLVKGRNVCRGQLIFEDNFNDATLGSMWKHEIKMPLDTEDAEFVSYQNLPENLFVQNNNLWIVPKLQTDFPTFDEERMYRGVLNFAETCTGKVNPNIECYRKGQRNIILPPVVSAKITTRESFSFQYGKIEIRAKLPKGDWIFPELYLNPLENAYGPNNYASGQMRVAFIRGNELLDSKDNTQIDGSRLSGGVILAAPVKYRDVWMKSSLIDRHLGDEFHTYSMTWTNTSVSVSLDGMVYANYRPLFKSQAQSQNITHSMYWDSAHPSSPFDKEFYLTLGVGVGGMADFPDLSRSGINRHLKPWNNTSPKAELFFWLDKNVWYPTWKGNDAGMQVDYVKVWAV